MDERTVNDIAANAMNRPSVYVPALVDEITRLRKELAECRLAMSCVRDLSEIVRMPNVEHVADAHNAAVKRLRAALAAKEETS